MLKRLIFLLVIWTAYCGGADTTAWADILVQGADPAQITVTYELGELSLAEKNMDGHLVTVVSLAGAVPGQTAGEPELPTVATSLSIPPTGIPMVRIVSRTERELATAPVMPSLGHVTRDLNPATMTRFFGPAYGGNRICPSSVVALGRPFLLGNRRGVNLRLNPLRWDAARGVLLITESITIEVTTSGPGGANILPPNAPETSTAFRRLQVQAMSNLAAQLKSSTPDKYTAPIARGRMLIICADELAPALAPFRAWKARRGIATDLVLMSATDGSAVGLRQLVSERYFAQAGLTWLVLVGDKALVPTNAGTYDGSDADSPYAMILGDDLYPDLFVSRISAVNLTQVATQVAKFVAYERDPDTGADAAWYSRGAGVASDEGVPADYERADLLRTDLLSQDYVDVDRIYQGMGSSTATIAAAVNEGRSLINYLGHGSGLSWDSVSFGTADIAALTNGNHLPWIVDVSCFNGDFARETCFAEAWLRAGTPQTPAGAIGMIAASSLAPWTPPTVMQAEVVDLLTAGTRNTLGALYYSGLMRVLDEYDGIPVAAQVVEQNIVFGDASLMVRTRAPEHFVVSLPSIVDAGAGSIRLTVAGVRGGTVAITSAGQLLGAADFTDSGQVDVPLSVELRALSAVTVTVTGFNMVPAEGEVAIVAGASPVFTEALPNTPTLRGNFPNPFNPSTQIVFELPTTQAVALTVYDVRGHEVSRLVSATMAAGLHQVAWDGRDDRGRAMPSGVYFYRLVSGDGAPQRGRMVLSK